MASTERMCDSVKHIDRYAYKQTNVRATKFFISILRSHCSLRRSGIYIEICSAFVALNINVGDHGDSLERAHVLIVVDERRNSACVASHNHGTRRNCWTLSLSRTTPSREAAVNIQQNRESSLDRFSLWKSRKLNVYEFHEFSLRNTHMMVHVWTPFRYM